MLGQPTVRWHQASAISHVSAASMEQSNCRASSRKWEVRLNLHHLAPRSTIVFSSTSDFWAAGSRCSFRTSELGRRELLGVQCSDHNVGRLKANKSQLCCGRRPRSSLSKEDSRGEGVLRLCAKSPIVTLRQKGPVGPICRMTSNAKVGTVVKVGIVLSFLRYVGVECKVEPAYVFTRPPWYLLPSPGPVAYASLARFPRPGAQHQSASIEIP